MRAKNDKSLLRGCKIKLTDMQKFPSGNRQLQNAASKKYSLSVHQQMLACFQSLLGLGNIYGIEKVH